MTTLSQMMKMRPFCRDDERRGDIIAHPVLNGIDHIEYELRTGILEVPDQHVLLVYFLKPLSVDSPGADHAYGLTLSPHLVHIQGGTRIPGIEIRDVRLVDDHLLVEVDQAGDFSDYYLALGWMRGEDGDWTQTISELDPVFSIAPVNFKAGCPVDFDCRQDEYCPPEVVEEPIIDYMAKDYASFRRLLIDLIPQLNPNWVERNPSDLGIALVELLSYAGDHLSYYQDAVALEAHLDSARQRASVRRHAKLVDYRMHDGRNAWTFVHVAAESRGVVERGAKFLTRVMAPLRGSTRSPGDVLAELDVPEAVFDSDPALAGVQVFETAFTHRVHPHNNHIHIHSWGDFECCLPSGSTCVDLFWPGPTGDGPYERPELGAGDYLLLEEIAGPTTGLAADADPAHRQVVRVTRVRQIEDPVYSVPLLRVFWDANDALKFPLCISARQPDGEPLMNLSVARGNIILADHGRTVRDTIALVKPVAPGQRFQPRLARAPLTHQIQTADAVYDDEERLLASDRLTLSGATRAARPAVRMQLESAAGPSLWTPVPDLLDSPSTAQQFVAEVDDAGHSTLRFGDHEYGRHPAGTTGYTAVYRVGNGRAGNVGADTLVHIVQPAVTPDWPSIGAVRNPIAARDGQDPETIEEVQHYAPAAFHAEQFRAVTEDDYATAARKIPEVAGAVARFRWTGSWYTVFIGIDPRDPEALVTEPGGRTRLTDDLTDRVKTFLNRYRLAGYDLEIRAGRYVSLEIDLHVCVLPGYFRGDVGEAVRQALSNRVNSNGSKGLFHPDHFTFAEPVYLSRLYTTIEKVAGVDSVIVTRFQRFGQTDNGELDNGAIPMDVWEIARLDNDPNFMENGVLRINLGGGK